MKITPLAGRINVNVSVLREYLDFMVHQNLIEREKITKTRVSYMVTQRGITVLRYFHELEDVLSGLKSMESLPLPINKHLRKRGEFEDS